MIEINLLPGELRPKAQAQSQQVFYLLNATPFIFGILICIHLFLAALAIFKGSEFLFLNSKWQRLAPQRKILEDFKKEYTTLSEDAQLIQQLTRQRIIWSQSLNKLSSDLPSGVWLNNVSITPSDFTLSGSVMSLQKNEMALIDELMDNLKNDPVFFKDFKNLDLTSTKRKTIGGYEEVDFTLAGALK